MADNKLQSLQGLNSRQKATVGVFLVVVIVIIWQVWGLVGGGVGKSASEPTQAIVEKSDSTNTSMAAAAPTGQSSMPTPPANTTAQNNAMISQRESELIKLQQETQVKYLSAINELQMLKISREIAETNQGIARAKLETVTAEKGVLDLFTKAPPPSVPVSSYANSLVSPGEPGLMAGTGTLSTQNQSDGTSFIVLSVSYLLNKWGAVMGYQGKLYNVAIGDVLPSDGSVVVSISNAGVLLRKNGATKKVSLVAAI